MHRLAAAALLSSALAAQEPVVTNPTEPRPAELGTVHWQRDLDAALAAAAKARKPVFLLFQEIPGCATCTGFGTDVLAQPLLVSAIEACFVPVVWRSNVDGPERAVLARYGEPTWNNPVVRFVDAAGKDLIARKDGVFDAHGIAARMIAALERAKRPVPAYLRAAHDESDPELATAVFAMHCFWEGEAVFGTLHGVVRTRAAFQDGDEVVEVTFRPSVVSREVLTALAEAQSCRPVTDGARRPAPAGDQQHALGGTPYAELALTPMQRTKVHAALTRGQDPKVWLTPAQAAALAAAAK